MNVVESKKVCVDHHNRVFFLRVAPIDLKQTLKDIFQELSDLSWISKFDKEYVKTSFQERAESTLDDIKLKLFCEILMTSLLMQENM